MAVDIHPSIAAFAQSLAAGGGADAVLFYGSNLRTGALEGVLDFYLLMPGPQRDRIWPLVSYHESTIEGRVLRAKVATMSLATFHRAAAGQSRDTTIWARFAQPAALVWSRSDTVRIAVEDALAQAAITAARIAAALGPETGTEDAYWRALFRATYEAEFRVEKAGREASILSLNAAHFSGLLPAAWRAADIAFAVEEVGDGPIFTVTIADADRRRIARRWVHDRRWGKPLNIVRLLKASTTFEGAGRYAAWKIERHTGVPVVMNAWREKHPVLAAPAVLFQVWRARKKAQKKHE